MFLGAPAADQAGRFPRARFPRFCPALLIPWAIGLGLIPESRAPKWMNCPTPDSWLSGPGGKCCKPPSRFIFDYPAYTGWSPQSQALKLLDGSGRGPCAGGYALNLHRARSRSATPSDAELEAQGIADRHTARSACHAV